MMQYCFGINTIILLSVSQLGTLFASDASFWCYININELYIKKRLFLVQVMRLLLKEKGGTHRAVSVIQACR